MECEVFFGLVGWDKLSSAHKNNEEWGSGSSMDSICIGGKMDGDCSLFTNVNSLVARV